MISILSVLEVEVDSHVQESRMNKALPYCFCAISATRFITWTLVVLHQVLCGFLACIRRHTCGLHTVLLDFAA